MTVKNLYRYVRPDGGITVSPIEPQDVEYTIEYRLIADEDKAITNGEIIVECIDVQSPDGWSDCDKPEE